MADLTEFLKRERGISELSFAGLGFKAFIQVPSSACSGLSPSSCPVCPAQCEKVHWFISTWWRLCGTWAMERSMLPWRLYGAKSRNKLVGERPKCTLCPPSVVSPVHCHSRLGYILQAGISQTGLQRDQGFNTLSLAPRAEFWAL